MHTASQVESVLDNVPSLLELTSGLARRHVCENTLKWGFFVGVRSCHSCALRCIVHRVKLCRSVLEQNGAQSNNHSPPELDAHLVYRALLHMTS